MKTNYSGTLEAVVLQSTHNEDQKIRNDLWPRRPKLKAFVGLPNHCYHSLRPPPPILHSTRAYPCIDGRWTNCFICQVGIDPWLAQVVSKLYERFIYMYCIECGEENKSFVQTSVELKVLASPRLCNNVLLYCKRKNSR